jgi:hypothetical protein
LSTPPKALLVLANTGNTLGNTLAIVRPVSLVVIASTPSGPDPHEVVA